MIDDEYSVRATTAISALRSHKEQPFIKYQWEELVMRLSRLNDPQLRDIVCREMEAIRKQDPVFDLL